MSSLIRFGLSGLPSPEGPAFIVENCVRVLQAAIPTDGAKALLRLARLSTEAVSIVADNFIALVAQALCVDVKSNTEDHVKRQLPWITVSR